MSLSAEQVAAYHRRGFLVEDNVFTADEVAELSDAVFAAIDLDATTSARGVDEVVHILEITPLHEAFARLACEPRLLARVAALIGDNVQLHHSKICAQPPVPDAGGFGWHQDFSFNPHTNTDMLTIMVMLDDAGLDNGCMLMIPGAHERGPLRHTIDGWHQVGCTDPTQWSDESVHVPITPRAGGISIHHCLMLHGTGPNITGAPRRGLTFHYRAGDAYQLAGEVFSDTGWQLLGERQDRIRCTLDRIELPRRHSWERVLGTANGPAAAAQRGRHALALERCVKSGEGFDSRAFALAGLHREQSAGAF